MSRCAIYCRVSTNRQEDEGSSLGTQLDACRAYASTRNYEVIGEFSDTWTGTQYRERPSLSQLRAQIRAGNIDVVVCHALDRLSRDQTHTAVLVDEIEHYGCRLDLVTEAFDDTSTGRLIRSVQSFAAELEREKIIERSMRGRRARVEAGKLLPTGMVLYGYRWRDETKSQLDSDPETVPIVERIYREYVQGSSIRTIADALSAAGIPTPTRQSNRWQYATVRNILRNAAYKGQAFGWGYRHSRPGKPQYFDSEQAIELPEGTIAPIVSADVWDTAQRRLATNQQRSRRNAKEPEAALLRSGFARCGHCGWALKARPKTGGRYEYICGRRSSLNDCLGPSILVSTLDSAAWGRVEHLMFAEGVIEQEIKRQREDDPAEVDMIALDRRLANLSREIDNLVMAIGRVQSTDAASSLAARLDQLHEQRRSVEAERTEIQRRRVDWQKLEDQIVEFGMWKHTVAERLPMLTWKDKRGLLDLLGIEAQLWRSGHDPRYTITSKIMPSLISTPAW